MAIDVLPELLAFLEGLAQLWVKNPSGFFAAALFLAVSIFFLFAWALGLIVGVIVGLYFSLTRLTGVLNSFAKAIKGARISFQPSIGLNPNIQLSNDPNTLASLSGMYQFKEITDESGQSEGQDRTKEDEE